VLIVKRLSLPLLLFIPLTLVPLVIWYTPITNHIDLGNATSLLGSIGLSIAAVMSYMIEPKYKLTAAFFVIILGTLLAYSLLYLFHLDFMREGFQFADAKNQALRITIPIPMISIVALMALALLRK